MLDCGIFGATLRGSGAGTWLARGASVAAGCEGRGRCGCFCGCSAGDFLGGEGAVPGSFAAAEEVHSAFE